MSNILSQRWLLNRRHFLRGAGAAVALPLLDAMTPLHAADGGGEAAPQRVRLHSQRRQRHDVAGHQAGPRLRSVALAQAPGKAPRRLHRVQRPASSQRPRPGARLRRHLADRRQDRRPERPQVREHRLLRPADGRGRRAADAVPVAGTLHQFGHRAAGQLHHAGLLARRRAAAGRGQSAPRLRPPLRRGGRRRRRATRPARTAPKRARRRARRRQVPPPRAGGDDRTKLDEYLHSVRDVEQRAARLDSWLDVPKPKVDRRQPPPSSATCPRPRPANTGAPCST